jgi:polar amino acid transport system substrate-binding protein
MGPSVVIGQAPSAGRRGVATLCALAAALTLSGCAADTGSKSSKGAAIQTPVVVEKIDEIAATLPGQYLESGTIVVGVSVPYPPNEFKDENGELTGFDVDLMNAVATTLGLDVEYKESGFAKIIPSVASGAFDVGMSSITDTKEREKLVDFVTYFNAGTLWAQRPGSDIDPKNACGTRIAVKATTIHEKREMPERNKACVEAGKKAIKIVDFIDYDQVVQAVIDGKVDAMTADSPFTSYAIKQSDGKLEAAGPVSDIAPYGWPVKKESPLGQSLLQALQSLIKSGAYKQIATKWGLAAGMLEKPVINGAAS